MEYNYKIDTVKFWCIIAVILIHLTAFIQSTGIATFMNYYSYRYYFNLAVPFFFAASGYLLAHKSDLAYFKEYAKKIFFMYIFFSLFYIVVNIIYAFLDRLILRIPFWKAVKTIINSISIENFFKGQIGSFHLWFLASLVVGTFFLIITLHLNLNANTILLIAFLLYAGDLGNIIDLDKISYYYSITKPCFYLSVGFYVAKKEISIKYPLIYFILSMIMYAINSFYFHASMGEFLLASATFFLIYYCKANPGRESVFSKMGKYTLNIYILHVFIYNSIYKTMRYIKITSYNDSAWKIILVAVLCVVFSIILFKPLDLIMQHSIKIYKNTFK